MASCDFCNTTILFGGSFEGNHRFCSDACRSKSILLKEASRLPAEWVRGQTQAVHSGSCPKCGGTGPVDVHKAHRVWSAVFLTSWSSHPAISCRKCALKRQAGSLLYSLVLGWWGLPWGLIWTPVQVVRNVIGMVKPPSPDAPSPSLERAIAFELAAQQLQPQPGTGVPPPLPPE
jgi:hypothetical protein